MKLFLTEKVKRALKENMLYAEREFGTNVARRFYKNVIQTASLLELFPYMAPLELLLKDRRYEYRSLCIQPHFKLIYRVDEANRIVYGVDFWDTRRDPNQLTTKLTIDD